MRRQHGFTLAELVIVLVLVGILSVVVIPRLTNQSGFAARGAHDFIGAGLRYAQKSAIAMRRNVCVAVASDRMGVTYAAAAGSAQACAAALVNPGNGLAFDDNSNMFPGGSTVTAASNVVFDAQGRPSTALTITVNGYATPVTLEAETGRVR